MSIPNSTQVVYDSDVKAIARSCIAGCCTTLQHAADYCRVLQGDAECCSVLQSIATCCKALHRAAGRCSAMQSVDFLYRSLFTCIWVSFKTYIGLFSYAHKCLSHTMSLLTHFPAPADHAATRCNTLQQTATHCNTLQHTATRCNTLQHTATYCNTLQHTYYSTLKHIATR